MAKRKIHSGLTNNFAKLFSIVAIIALGLSVYIALNYTTFGNVLGYTTQLAQTSSSGVPSTTFMLSPQSNTVLPNTTFSESIVIDTGANNIMMVEIELLYDSTKIEVNNVINSSNFPHYLSSPSIQPGRVLFSVATTSISQPFKGKGALAEIQLTAKTAQSTPVILRFGPGTFARSLEAPNSNMTIGTQPAQITISTSRTTPTPIVCTSGYVTGFSVASSCNLNSFRTATVQCSNGYKTELGNSSTCKSLQIFVDEATNVCRSQSSCVSPTVRPPMPTMTPTGTKKPIAPPTRTPTIRLVPTITRTTPTPMKPVFN